MKDFSIIKGKNKFKKICFKISFSINNKSNLNKERLEKLIDEYFERLDKYEIIYQNAG